MPLLLSASHAIYPISRHSVPTSMWVTWGAAVAFVVSWGLLQFACPPFVREYRDFGEYAQRKHSHRWIVWEFHHNVMSLQRWQTIVQETLAKGISVHCETPTLDVREYALCPIFPAPPDAKTVKVFEPVNANRDIYMPIHCFGRRLVLLLQEDDPKLSQKEKELFWILYTEAAKERPGYRAVYWSLIGLAALLVGFTVLKNIWLGAVGFADVIREVWVSLVWLLDLLRNLLH